MAKAQQNWNDLSGIKKEIEMKVEEFFRLYEKESKGKKLEIKLSRYAGSFVTYIYVDVENTKIPRFDVLTLSQPADNEMLISLVKLVSVAFMQRQTQSKNLELLNVLRQDAEGSKLEFCSGDSKNKGTTCSLDIKFKRESNGGVSNAECDEKDSIRSKVKSNQNDEDWPNKCHKPASGKDEGLYVGIATANSEHRSQKDTIAEKQPSTRPKTFSTKSATKRGSLEEIKLGTFAMNDELAAFCRNEMKESSFRVKLRIENSKVSTNAPVMKLQSCYSKETHLRIKEFQEKIPASVLKKEIKEILQQIGEIVETRESGTEFSGSSENDSEMPLEITRRIGTIVDEMELRAILEYLSKDRDPETLVNVPVLPDNGIEILAIYSKTVDIQSFSLSQEETERLGNLYLDLIRNEICLPDYTSGLVRMNDPVKNFGNLFSDYHVMARNMRNKIGIFVEKNGGIANFEIELLFSLSMDFTSSFCLNIGFERGKAAKIEVVDVKINIEDFGVCNLLEEYLTKLGHNTEFQHMLKYAIGESALCLGSDFEQQTSKWTEDYIKSFARSFRELKKEQRSYLPQTVEHTENLPLAIIPEDEIISDEELDLAYQLRRMCTSKGKERLESLTKTGHLLMKMGELYLKKTSKTGGMLQKLTFIRCCALLVGAKVRFELNKDNDESASAGLEAIQKSLSEFSGELLRHATKDQIEVNIFDLSKNVLEAFKKARLEANKEISKIDCRGEGKTIKIEKLMVESTKKYISIIKGIAESIENMMGTPPRSYSLIGLGSMARNEITFYSDCEDVIVLEEGCQDRPDYEVIKEYFRWFSVVFQAIVIGVGETFIRSVGVRSLNDLYSDDKSKNWFYDDITPCGVSCDGTIPHSCNNPIGRVQATAKRPHSVELIQPVSIMANFLTTDQHIKNGYYVKDVLSRTCFIHGSEEVYHNFLTESEKVLRSEDTKNSKLFLLDAVEFNVNAYVSSSKTFGGKEPVNQKVVIYRPITSLVSYLGRVFGVTENSTMDIITDLFKKEIITKKGCDELRKAVAVACELRLKMYAKVGHQRHSMLGADILNLVGKESGIECLTLIQVWKRILLWTIRSDPDVEMSFPLDGPYYKAQYQTDKVRTLTYFGFHEDAVEQCEFIEPVIEWYNNTDIRYVTIGEAHFEYAQDLNKNYAMLNCKSPATEELLKKHYSIAENHFKLALGEVSLDSIEKSKCLLDLASIYHTQKRYDEGLSLVDEWNKHFQEEDKVSGPRIMSYYSAWRTLELDFKRRCLDPDKLKRFLNSRISSEQNFSSRLQIRLILIEDNEEKTSVKTEYSRVVLEIKAARSKFNYLEAVNILLHIMSKQCKMGWKEDCLKTLEVCDSYVPDYGEHTEFDESFYRFVITELFAAECYQECASRIFRVPNREGRVQWGHFFINLSQGLKNKIQFVTDVSEMMSHMEMTSEMISALKVLWLIADRLNLYELIQTQLAIVTSRKFKTNRDRRIFETLTYLFISQSMTEYLRMVLREESSFRISFFLQNFVKDSQIFVQTIESLLFPLNTLLIHFLSAILKSRQNFELPSPLNDISAAFYSKHRIQQPNKIEEVFNRAVTNFEYGKKEECCQCLWTVIVSECPSYLLTKAIEMMFPMIWMTVTLQKSKNEVKADELLESRILTQCGELLF